MLSERDLRSYPLGLNGSSGPESVLYRCFQGSELVAEVVLVHVGYVSERSRVLFQHLDDDSFEGHHVSRVMPEDFGNKGVLTHDLVLVEVALFLELVNEVESVGGHHGADQSAGTGVLHLVLVFLEIVCDFRTDGIQRCVIFVRESIRNDCRALLWEEGALGV